MCNCPFKDAGQVEKKRLYSVQEYLVIWKKDINGKLFMPRANKFIYHHDSFICDSDYVIQNPGDCSDELIKKTIAESHGALINTT